MLFIVSYFRFISCGKKCLFFKYTKFLCFNVDVHFIFQVEELYCELNYHDLKSGEYLPATYGNTGHLCVMWIDGSVVEFWLCILWSLVRSTVGEIMV